MRLVLTNGLDEWLQLRYEHAYERTPLGCAYTRPLARHLCLTMLAYSPVSPVPTALPGARAGRWTRRWCSSTARMHGCSRSMRMHTAARRLNAPILAT